MDGSFRQTAASRREQDDEVVRRADCIFERLREGVAHRCGGPTTGGPHLPQEREPAMTAPGCERLDHTWCERLEVSERGASAELVGDDEMGDARDAELCLQLGRAKQRAERNDHTADAGDGRGRQRPVDPVRQHEPYPRAFADPGGGQMSSDRPALIIERCVGDRAVLGHERGFVADGDSIALQQRGQRERIGQRQGVTKHG
jgi:hypothetical protein